MVGGQRGEHHVACGLSPLVRARLALTRTEGTLMMLVRILMVSAAVTLLAACGRTEPVDTARPNATTDAGGRAAPTPPATSVPPDNSATNARDRDGATMTPMDQKENEVDLTLTKKIRQGVIDAEGLSITAKNVKIITADGRVTLRGPVKSVDERNRIVAVAAQLAGANNVDDQLEVE